MLKNALEGKKRIVFGNLHKFRLCKKLVELSEILKVVKPLKGKNYIQVKIY